MDSETCINHVITTVYRIHIGELHVRIENVSDSDGDAPAGKRARSRKGELGFVASARLVALRLACLASVRCDLPHISLLDSSSQGLVVCILLKSTGN